MPRIRALAVTSALLAAVAATAPAAHAENVDLSVLSSRADQVSGGDALIRVDAPKGLLDKLQVLRNGDDVTDAFEPQDGGLVGLVAGLELGTTSWRSGTTAGPQLRSRSASRSRTTRPRGRCSPGPHQKPFVCKTIQAGLGEPLVDNQAGDGFRVLTPGGSTAGWSRDCSATRGSTTCTAPPTELQARCRPTAPRPANMAQTTTARRPHRRLRRAPRARHDQPLHLLVRDARAARRGPGARRTPRSGTAA